jgi:hypothetical protein
MAAVVYPGRVLDDYPLKADDGSVEQQPNNTDPDPDPDPALDSCPAGEDHEGEEAGSSTPRAASGVDPQGSFVAAPSLVAQLDAIPDVYCEDGSCKRCAIYRPRWFRDDTSIAEPVLGGDQAVESHEDSSIEGNAMVAQTETCHTLHEWPASTAHLDRCDDDGRSDDLSISLSGGEGGGVDEQGREGEREQMADAGDEQPGAREGTTYNAAWEEHGWELVSVPQQMDAEA